MVGFSMECWSIIKRKLIRALIYFCFPWKKRILRFYCGCSWRMPKLMANANVAALPFVTDTSSTSDYFSSSRWVGEAQYGGVKSLSSRLGAWKIANLFSLSFRVYKTSNRCGDFNLPLSNIFYNLPIRFIDQKKRERELQYPNRRFNATAIGCSSVKRGTASSWSWIVGFTSIQWQPIEWTWSIEEETCWKKPLPMPIASRKIKALPNRVTGCHGNLSSQSMLSVSNSDWSWNRAISAKVKWFRQ